MAHEHARLRAPGARPQWGVVNGWMYYGPRAGDPSAYDALAVAAEETMRTRRWMTERERWHDVDRPRIVAANLALQEAEPDVRAAIGHYRAVAPLHFELHTAFSVGGGAAVRELRAVGLSLADVLPLLAGHSPASARARDLIDAIVREEAGARDAYLREYGWRCLDQHAIGQVLLERPDILDASVEARRAATAARRRRPTSTPFAVGRGTRRASTPCSPSFACCTA